MSCQVYLACVRQLVKPDNLLARARAHTHNFQPHFIILKSLIAHDTRMSVQWHMSVDERTEHVSLRKQEMHIPG